MKTREDYIRKFQEVFGLDVESEPSVKLFKLRKTLIEEEVKELFQDIDSAISFLEKGEEVPKSLYVNMLKELADVQVVVSGMSVSIKPLKNLDKAFVRVFESNMSKVGDDGKPIFREDGKVLKGPNYKTPNLTDLV